MSSETKQNQRVSIETIQKNRYKSDENRKALENLIFKIRFDFCADVENLIRDFILPELNKILSQLDEVIDNIKYSFLRILESLASILSYLEDLELLMVEIQKKLNKVLENQETLEFSKTKHMDKELR